METVNGSRNPFAVREALDKRSASVFPALTRDRFLRQFIFQCHNFLIHRRCGVVVPVENCFHPHPSTLNITRKATDTPPSHFQLYPLRVLYSCTILL